MCSEKEGMEQLREQFGVLQRKLASQQIVNERLVRGVVSGKMSWNRGLVRFEMWVALPLVVLLFGMFYAVGMVSWRLWLFVVTTCAVDTWLDYRINRAGDRHWLEGDLLSARRELVRMNRLRKQVFWCEMPLLLLVMVAIVADLVMHGMPVAFTGGAIAGGIMGVAVAFGIYRKMQRNNDEAIRAIDDFADD